MGDAPGKQDGAERLRQRALLKERGWSILRELGAAPGKLLRVRCGNPHVEVEIMVRRTGLAPGGNLEECGLLGFTERELSVLNAIGPEGCLVLKQLSSRTNIPEGPILSLLVRGLIERKALDKVLLKDSQADTERARFQVRWSSAYRAYRGLAEGRQGSDRPGRKSSATSL